MKRYTRYETKDPNPGVPFNEDERKDHYALPIAICLLVVVLILEWLA